jgi:glycogen operon protein
MRGIDNKSYYYLMEEEKRYYNDSTGTGNTLNLSHPNVLRMVMDSLRYWVKDMRVDGFRFDLATSLARDRGKFDEHASFLEVVAQDPILSSVKLIAEPWDTAPSGYQLGRFPPAWAEWNDRYRDTVRRFWRGDGGQLPELASRLSGSSDIYDQRGRRPWASVNFVTAHDGFTLHDLVSYNSKHNEANLEDNLDGHEHNYACNNGVEGAADEPEILQHREQQKRNLLTSLLFSQGVPMLLAGDEFGQTQHGNNNAYCQDNETTWLDWGKSQGEGKILLAFFKSLVGLRREHIIFHRHRFFHGKSIRGTKSKDVLWLKPDGQVMRQDDWSSRTARSLAMLISGEAGKLHLTERGEREPDDTFILILNATDETVEYVLPEAQALSAPVILIDTSQDVINSGTKQFVDDSCLIAPHAFVVIIYPRCAD